MTDTINAPEGKETLGIGAIISDTFGIFASNFPLFFALAALPYFLINLVILGMFPALDLNDPNAAFTAIALTAILTSLVFVVVQGVMIRSAVALKTGNGTQLNEAVSAALRGFFPILLLGMAYGILMMLGFLALIVPGLIVMAMFSVYIPAIVFEGKGFGALQRSSELTKGYRPAIIGALLAVGVMVGIITSAASMVVAAVSPGAYAASGQIANLAGAIAEAIVQGVTAPLSMIVTGLIFVRLREIKEGGAAEDLVRIFE